MLRTDRLCVWIVIIGLTLLVPSYSYVKFNDEICSMSLLGVAMLDCMVNSNWRRYRLLFIIVGVMTFYALFTLIFKHYNTPEYVLVDWIIEIKPYIPFAVLFAVRPKLTAVEKKIIRVICMVNAMAAVMIFACGENFVFLAVHHVSYIGITCFVSAMFYLYCSLDEEFSVSRRKLAITILMLTAGLCSTRAKYYGIYVVSLFFLTLYRPGMFRRINLKGLAVGLTVIALIFMVTWSKVDFYYLSGNEGKFDRSVAESFARPVLYATAGLIFMQQFPFGSGLASIATYASQQNYSTLYYEYGIDKVYGLSPQTGFFICDAFYPSLAQYGVLGLCLFVAFWVYAYSFIRRMIRLDGLRFRYPVAIGIILMSHIMIESTSANTFTQPPGMIVLSMLGIICGRGTLIAVECPRKTFESEKIERLEYGKI